MQHTTPGARSPRLPTILLLLAGAVAVLAPACGKEDPCEGPIGDLTVSPDQSPCTSLCDCNNQRFTGECVAGSCQSQARGDCQVKGQLRDCIAYPSKCRGVQECHPAGLRFAVWGDCDCSKGPKTPPPKEEAGEAQIVVDGLTALAQAGKREYVTLYYSGQVVTPIPGAEKVGSSTFSANRRYEITATSVNPKPSLDRVNLRPGSWKVTVEISGGWKSLCSGEVKPNETGIFKFSYGKSTCPVQ